MKRAFQALHAQAHLVVDRQGTGPTLAKLHDVVTSIELHLAHLARVARLPPAGARRRHVETPNGAA